MARNLCGAQSESLLHSSERYNLQECLLYGVSDCIGKRLMLCVFFLFILSFLLSTDEHFDESPRARCSTSIYTLPTIPIQQRQSKRLFLLYHTCDKSCRFMCMCELVFRLHVLAAVSVFVWLRMSLRSCGSSGSAAAAAWFADTLFYRYSDVSYRHSITRASKTAKENSIV